jgi:hypothetical protein
MITIRTWMKADNGLITVEQFNGPIADENYIEGAIELSVEGKPILTREMVDYVDQLWAYLIRGLGEIGAGREFSTYYPDMPFEVVLRPRDGRVTITIDPSGGGATACVAIDELCAAMATAGTLFFERLRSLAPGNQAMYSRYLVDLAKMTKGSPPPSW